MFAAVGERGEYRVGISHWKKRGGGMGAYGRKGRGGGRKRKRGRLTDVFVLDVTSGLAVQLGLGVGFLGHVLDEHFLDPTRVSDGCSYMARRFPL